MEELKTLLGEELFNQVMEKVGDTPITVGEGKIPLERFNEVNTKKKELETTLATVQEELNTVKAERDTLTASVKDLQGKMNTSNIEHRVMTMLKDSKAKNPGTVKTLLGLKDLEDTEECYTNVQSLIDSLKSSDPYLFDGNVVAGNEPSTSNTNGGAITKKDFEKMSYKERVNLYNTNKELYDTLSK